MATDKRKMIIEVGVKDDTAKGTASVNKNQESMGTTAEETSLAMAAAWTAAFAAVAVGATAIIRTTAEFQKLRAMLKVATGDAARAAVAFDAIKQFALETPFTVNQVTEAFIKLKNLGLDPSMEALRSYGNTSAAMGKDVTQMIEAVADASVGEFERLKEFGIKASKQGDEVKFTFRGVTTTVKNSSEDIQGYLKDIGNNEFAGSMQAQMETLDGAFSNAGVAIDNLSDVLGSVLSPKIIEVANAFAAATDSLRAFLAPNTQDEIKSLTEDLEQLTAQITEGLELDPDGGAVIDSLELQSRIIVQKLTELKEKVKTDKLTLADITAGPVIEEGEISAAEAQAVKQAEAVNDFLFQLEADHLENGAIWDEKQRQLRIEAFNQEREDTQEQYELLDLFRQDDVASDRQASEQKARTQAMLHEELGKGLTNLSALMNSESRKAFEVGKVASIAQTTINTYDSATSSYKALSGIPIVGPYLGAAAAAAAVVAGLANVQAISATSFGGGGGGGGSSYSGIATNQTPAVNGDTSQFQPQPQPAVAAEALPPIIVENPGGLLGKWIEEQLAPALLEAQSRGVQTVIV